MSAKKIYGGGDGSSSGGVYGNYGPVFKPGCGPPELEDCSGNKSGPFGVGGGGHFSVPAGICSTNNGGFCWGTRNTGGLYKPILPTPRNKVSTNETKK